MFNDMQNLLKRSLTLTESFLSDSYRMMALMMLSLHALLLLDHVDNMRSALFLCHYGCFLLWQPMIRQSNNLSWRAITFIGMGAFIGMLLLNWWMIAFWISGLFALISGRIFSEENSLARLSITLASSYLLAILLLWVLPKLLKSDDDLADISFIISYILPLIPFVILFLPRKNKSLTPSANVDFLYTLLVFLLSSIIILASFAIGVVWKIHYIELIIVVLMSLAASLVVLSWLWNPSDIFSGLELIILRYLLSVGLPFEDWIRQIAKYAEYEKSPEKFLQASMNELVLLNWVSGVMWEVDGTKNQVGQETSFVSTFNFYQLHLKLYSRWKFSPSMYLHIKLLTQILGEFYEAKRREEIITQNTYIQSLYETGARLTHDIKNILQSMGALSALAEQSSNDGDDDARLIDFVRKQMPRLNKRLANALLKLERPGTEKINQEKIDHWWRNFKQINAHLKISFEAPSNMPKIDIDSDTLDSVMDNLLQNALLKARLETNTLIHISLTSETHLCIELTDTGSAIPTSVADRLFKSHVSSKNGLGVGLFHAAQQASNAGYKLSLVDNREGEVRFRLESVLEGKTT